MCVCEIIQMYMHENVDISECLYIYIYIYIYIFVRGCRYLCVWYYTYVYAWECRYQYIYIYMWEDVNICVWDYCDGKLTKIPKRDFIFARVKTGQVGTWSPYRISPRSEFFSQAYENWHITWGNNLGPDWPPLARGSKFHTITHPPGCFLPSPREWKIMSL